jgi:hypothetical protein
VALLPFVVARDVHDRTVLEPTLAHVVGVHEHHAAPVANSPVSVVQSVDRRIELVVTADRRQHELPGGETRAR